MAYSDFTLEKAVRELGVNIAEQNNLFQSVISCEPSPYIQMVLSRHSALSPYSGKARSEKYIAPILDDVFSQIPETFTVFSGENFDVDKTLKLKGAADFIICMSNTKFLIQMPVIALAESKKNDPVDGLGQCIAELFASALFNQKDNKIIPKLFGISSNGNIWMFAEYIVNEKKFTYDPYKYTLPELPRILGILSFMRDESLRMYDSKSNN